MKNQDSITYKQFNIYYSGLVRFKGHYVNKYDSVSSAKYAIDKGDADLTIAIRISNLLKNRFEATTPIEAMFFIKKQYKYSVKQIYEGYKLAYSGI